MDFRSLKYAAAACGGEWRGASPERPVNRVTTDSRQVRGGDLFFAIAGEKFDGHDFLAAAAGAGIAAAVVESRKVPENPRCDLIVVDSPRVALGRLAARYRSEFTLPVIAVGGSNGKTTTKELIASVLRRKLRTVWSEASFNNDIGVPLSLLKLEKTSEAAVFEVGTNHPGELPALVRMVQPGLGVITNIGREHLEFFKDAAGVADEEGRLAELLPADGKLFMNGDDEWTDRIAQRSPAKAVRVGFGGGNDWRAGGVRMDAGGSRFRVDAPKADWSGEYRINLLGEHQVVNAVFAVAIGAELGLTRAEIQQGLNECKPAKMRLETWNWNGVCVLNDAYNANADSMAAALRTLRQMPCEGRRVAVLGDMRELGGYSRSAHEETGRRAAELNVDQLFTVGEMADVTAAAARAAGMKNVAAFAEVGAAADAVKRFVKAGDVMLLKASRGARLERLAEVLQASNAAEKV